MSDKNGWELDPEDDSVVLVAAVGRQLKLWREAAGMDAAELAAAIGYSRDLVYKVERGLRVPQPDYLERADEVLEAGGKLAALRKDLAEARYPKKVRDIAKLEREAVELGSYNNSVIDGLLQTEAYARAVFGSCRPPFSEAEIERYVAARMARQEIVDASAAEPVFSYVMCEAALRRPLGGRMVMRRQLEHLVEAGHLRNVELQVLPLALEENSGLDGPFRLLKLMDGTMVGLGGVQLFSHVITDHKQVQALDLLYGVIRAQALSPQKSLAFIEKVLGET
ncbi:MULTISPECIES: helix-turn-helix domain-containing protein [Streptomyces]|uniref:helix-turn-helix domain-containing protein n=1 Tax=Streptomyces TaxID=1883 RepID=UPI00163CA1D5|nr:MULTISPECIES: helix-turn-helix transcriptional regulator [Streptomyces]MBC2873866.1 helix-turn-helix domain-containing protein [Streptomyces sp. TYQ1024]UBI39188.1 helix-turn-helix domain-containing protein [Streptomyces mobaraensis]UKW31770.1 helix-turn-helix domain-containing protein [Streptomyces sp. TYQ1024]